MDSYTETTTKGYGSRILDALKWVLVGFLLFFASFAVLYWNEWKVNLAEVAKTATHISTETQNLGELQGKLISTSGTLKAKEGLGDTYIKAGKYISLKRKVEVYAWVEKKREETHKNAWGSETTTTHYDYSKEWVDEAEKTSDFRYPEGHDNIAKSIQDASFIAENLQIENFHLDEKIMLPELSELTLTEENVILTGGLVREGNYLFQSYDETSNITEPKIWDVRISYEVLENPVKNTTVFGKLENKNTISTFIWPKESELYRAFKGNREESIKTLQFEHDMLTWGLRLLGFLMMWFGLVSILTPLSVVLDVIPFFGTLGEWAIKIFSFVVALVLSIVTIIISMIIHNVWALVIVILATLGGMYYFWKKKKEQDKQEKENIPTPIDGETKGDEKS